MLSLTNIFLRVGIIFILYTTVFGAGANYGIYRVNFAPLYENSKKRNPLRNELISYIEVSRTHTHKYTHTHIYMCVCKCVCVGFYTNSNNAP